MSGGSSTTYIAGYKYLFGIHMGICRGPVDELVEVRVGDRTAWAGSITGNATQYIDAPELFGGESGEGGVQGDLYVMMGASDQQAPGILTSTNAVIGSLGGSPVANLEGGQLEDFLHDSVFSPFGLRFWNTGEAEFFIGAEVSPLPDQWLTSAPTTTTYASLYEMRYSQISGSYGFGHGIFVGTMDTWVNMGTTQEIQLRKPDGSQMDGWYDTYATLRVEIRVAGTSTVLKTADFNLVSHGLDPTSVGEEGYPPGWPGNQGVDNTDG